MDNPWDRHVPDRKVDYTGPILLACVTLGVLLFIYLSYVGYYYQETKYNNNALQRMEGQQHNLVVDGYKCYVVESSVDTDSGNRLFGRFVCSNEAVTRGK